VPLNIIGNFEKTIVDVKMRDAGRPAGDGQVIALLVLGAVSLVFGSLPPEMPSADVRP
jgi:hypothetical protein